MASIATTVVLGVVVVAVVVAVVVVAVVGVAKVVAAADNRPDCRTAGWVDALAGVDRGEQ